VQVRLRHQSKAYSGVVSPRYDLPKAAPEPLRLVQRFVNSVDLENEIDALGSPPALASWLAEVGLPAEDEPTVDDLRRALELREAIRDLLHANNEGLPSRESVSVVNHVAWASRIGVQLDEVARVRLEPSATGVDAALGVILAVSFEAMVDGSWSRLKSCRNCHWVFHDYSRNRSAKWCSMSLCGNRLKTRTYRERGRRTPR
jgi:predicted RNA-binding Zn ribbon-like protein